MDKMISENYRWPKELQNTKSENYPGLLQSLLPHILTKLLEQISFNAFLKLLWAERLQKAE
jgi:hypothetical protein